MVFKTKDKRLIKRCYCKIMFCNRNPLERKIVIIGFPGAVCFFNGRSFFMDGIAPVLCSDVNALKIAIDYQHIMIEKFGIWVMRS